MTPKKVISNEEQRHAQPVTLTVGQFEDIYTCISNLSDSVEILSNTVEQIFAFERRDASDIDRLFSEIAKLPKEVRHISHIGIG